MSTGETKSVLAEYYAHRTRVRRRLFKIVAIPLLGAIACAVIWMSWIAWTIHRQNERIEYLTGLGGKLLTTPVWPHELVAKVVGKEFAGGCVQFVRVDLEDTQAGDEALERISELSELEILWLGNTQVTDAGLQRIQSLQRLKNISLSNTQITDAGLQSLSRLQNLEHLYLTNTRITDAGMHDVGRLSKLTDLVLSGTLITNQGLAELSQLSALQRLDLVNCLITEFGIEPLLGLEHLKDVNLQGTAVTCMAIRRLEERRVYVRMSDRTRCFELTRNYNELTDAIKRDDTNAEAYLQRAYNNIDFGDHWSATDDLEQALKLGIDTGKLRNDLAIEYSKSGRHDEAILHYGAAIRHDPRETVYILNRGNLLLRTGQIEASIDDFSTAIEINPEDYKPYSLRYESYLALGESELARKDAETARRLNPDWKPPDLSGKY